MVFQCGRQEGTPSRQRQHIRKQRRMSIEQRFAGLMLDETIKETFSCVPLRKRAQLRLDCFARRGHAQHITRRGYRTARPARTTGLQSGLSQKVLAGVNAFYRSLIHTHLACNIETSCEAAAVVKPKASCCEPWV